MNPKVVLLDSSFFVFKAIYSWENNKTILPTWQYMNMVISCLRRLNLTKEDIIILAVDATDGNWRKELDSEYKANRKDLREKHVEIDWDYMFALFNAFLKVLDRSTPFNIIKISKLEADDIIAQSCHYFKDSEVIIVSPDTDFEMLTALSNVKIFSPISKAYKAIKNPYKILAKKIEVEKVDNLVSPLLNEVDFERRSKLVDLLHLPEDISKKVEERLSDLQMEKIYTIEQLPFTSLRKKFMDIYDSPIVIKTKKKVKKLKQEQLV